jgi:hypothetical protein
MADEFSIAFDSQSIREMALIAGVPILLNEKIQGTMRRVSSYLTEKAQAKTWEVFRNPTGKLASTIHPVRPSPYEAQIAVDSPYGRRREEGFDGADSLGRIYHDLPEPYLEPTLLEETAQVEAWFSEDIQQVLDSLAAHSYRGG